MPEPNPAGRKANDASANRDDDFAQAGVDDFREAQGEAAGLPGARPIATRVALWNKLAKALPGS